MERKPNMSHTYAKHHELYEKYDKDHCWQYDIRKNRIIEDMNEIGINMYHVNAMRTKDFDFEYVDKEEKEKCQEIVKFIEKHEWLGKMPSRPTHRFTARWKGHLAGVIIMSTPNAFSKIVGDETKDLEKLIARGACISWSPKNLGSWLIMKSMKWMVENTQFRIFTAYSDPEARELGSIYQACSFLYLGKQSGANKQYLDPNNEKIGWFSDRHFRHKSMYRKYAERIGIENWNQYMKQYSPDWSKMPAGMEEEIKNELKRYKSTCRERITKPKHKYVYIMGKDKPERVRLMKLFNKYSKSYPYPKNRGE